MATTIISSKEHPHFLDVDDKGVLKLRDNETISFNEPTDVEIGEDIYEIEEFLFAECADLKSLIIGSNLTKIGNSAFSNCTNLEQVKICRGSTKNKEMIIESSAFAGCKSLSNVSLSENVKTIGIRAFADCDNLKIKFLSYPNTIDKSTFDGCKSVEISLPYRCLESDVFKGFNKKIKIVENTDCFFYDHICYKVVSEENKTVSIADNSSLQSESLSLPSTIYYDNIKFTVTSIEDKAFYSNEFITHCELPKSLSSIGKAAFAYCSKLQSFRFPENEGENDKFLISSGVLYSKTEDYGLSMLSCPPLANGNHILILPENLKSIADYAFSGVSNLKRIYFKQPVEFSSNAFEDADLDNCYAFLGKELSENSSFLNDTPFKKTIQIGSQFEENGNVYSIESDYEFDHSTNNEAALVKWNQSDSSEVEIPETIEFVGVKYNVAKICETAFKSNAKITKLTITNAIKEIENNPFAVSTKLTEITVGKDNERFTAENGVLLEKTGKKERKLIAYPAGRNDMDYDIPENIVSIGENAFKNCSLTRIVIPKDDMITLDGKSGLPDKLDVVLPSVSAYKIYSKSSWNNYHLVLPDYEQEGIIYHLNVDKNRTAEIVDAKAGLKEVKIPVTVKFGDDDFKIVKICSDAFKKCTSLTKITCKSENPVTLEKDVFYKKMTVYVPSGCYDIYNSATNWNVHTILDGEKPDKFTVGKIIYSKMNDSEVSVQSVSGIASKDKLIIGSTVNYHNYKFKVVGIMKDAFKGINCTSVTIPASVTSIEDNPFKGCSAQIKIENGSLYKEEANGIFTLKNKKNKNLVFCQPSITEMTIPDDVTNIGDNAFASCPKLKIIDFTKRTAQPPEFDGESGCKDEHVVTVKVPIDQKSIYDKKGWGRFNVKELEKLTLSKPSINLCVDKTDTVQVTSGNGNYPSVVTPSMNGNSISVRALKAGTATVTVKDNVTGQGASIAVTVWKALTVSQKSINLVTNSSKTIEITSGTEPYNVNSNNESLVTVSVSENIIKIHGLRAGSTTISIKDKSQQSITIPVNIKDDIKEPIDLGLPSGTLWASCNVGAAKPEEFGGYFAWGETEEKIDYSWKTYKWCKGTENTQTKYNRNSKFGIVDNILKLTAEDDVASKKWGGRWSMPTQEMVNELFSRCEKVWTTINGVNGYKLTGPNKNSIFLPASGNLCELKSIHYNVAGTYWISDKHYDAPEVFGVCARAFNFSNSDLYVNNFYGTRQTGRSVRPVQVKITRPGIGQPTRPSRTNSSVVTRPSQTSSPSRNGGRRRR